MLKFQLLIIFWISNAQLHLAPYSKGSKQSKYLIEVIIEYASIAIQKIFASLIKCFLIMNSNSKLNKLSMNTERTRNT